jgi:pSer/pThr/pTyr-binding forkhead associated (FHA) protein
MATLIIDEGGAGERRIRLDDGVTTVGREADCEIRLAEDEELVAPHHACFQPERERWHVRDEGSEYGTFLNDRRVTEHHLEDGDLIELGLGGPVLRFVDDGPSDEAGYADEGDPTEVRQAFEAEDGPAG